MSSFTASSLACNANTKTSSSSSLISQRAAACCSTLYPCEVGAMCDSNKQDISLEEDGLLTTQDLAKEIISAEVLGRQESWAACGRLAKAEAGLLRIVRMKYNCFLLPTRAANSCIRSFWSPTKPLSFSAWASCSDLGCSWAASSSHNAASSSSKAPALRMMFGCIIWLYC